MKRRVLVAALALTLPLLLYGVPYAYAAFTSTYVKTGTGTGFAYAHCNTGDYATGGGGRVDNLVTPLRVSAPVVGNVYAADNEQPDGWIAISGPADVVPSVDTWVVCQHPATVAGVTVPEFGQLYLAIALGALVYFLLARRYSSTKPFSVRPS